MVSRDRIDDHLARSPVIGSEPQDGWQRFIHRDRASLGGYAMEARVWLKARGHNDTPKPFVIYARPRSGTTLLVRILNQVPQMRCDGEMLHHAVLRPIGFLSDLRRRAGPDVRAYGVKILSYQLMDVQRVLRPVAFFEKLKAQDFTIFHLVRNSWDQNLSLIKAHQTGLYYGDKAAQPDFAVDPARFAALLRWNEAMLAYENQVMEHVPHVRIDYDAQLRDKNSQADTVKGMCETLGLPFRFETEAPARIPGGKAPPQEIVNMDEILRHLQDEGLDHLVPDHLLHAT